MIREGLTILFEYREGGNLPYSYRTEIPLHRIDMADTNFEELIGYTAKNMWRGMEKELFDRA